MWTLSGGPNSRLTPGFLFQFLPKTPIRCHLTNKFCLILKNINLGARPSFLHWIQPVHQWVDCGNQNGNSKGRTHTRVGIRTAVQAQGTPASVWKVAEFASVVAPSGFRPAFCSETQRIIVSGNPLISDWLEIFIPFLADTRLNRWIFSWEILIEFQHPHEITDARILDLVSMSVLTPELIGGPKSRLRVALPTVVIFLG